MRWWLGYAADKSVTVVKFVIVIAPESAPQIYRPPLNGVEHPLAPEVMSAVLRHGSRPVSLWKSVNSLANAQNPDSRARRRSWRLRYLCALRELLRAGVLFRHGPLIATSNFATRPRPKSPRRSPPSVASSACKNGGSIPVAPKAQTVTNYSQTFDGEVVTAGGCAGERAPEVKSAQPTPAEITEAARALAQQSRRRKIWSGWLNGERMWRLRPVVVPGGKVLPAYFVRRGFVYALLPDTPEYQNRIFDRYRAEAVQIYRSPHAALLGRLPPRAGRKRGRPRTSPR